MMTLIKLHKGLLIGTCWHDADTLALVCEDRAKSLIHAGHAEYANSSPVIETESLSREAEETMVAFKVKTAKRRK